MTLFASVASLFCTFSVSAAAPSVAIVPAQTVNRVEIISPTVETSAVLGSESQVADDDVNAADVGIEGVDFTPDKSAANSSADDFLPADVATDDEEILPADVVVDGEEILPADVVADIDAGADALSEAEGVALAEASADAGTLVDEPPEEDLAPTAPPSEEPGAKSDSGASSGDGEAAS